MAGDIKGTGKDDTPEKGKTDSSAAPAKPATTPSAGKVKTPQTPSTADKKSPAAKPDSVKTDTAPSTPEPEKTAHKKSGSGRFAWTLVFLLLFFIGGVAATPYILPQVLPLLPEQAKPYFAPLTQSASAGPDISGLTAKLNQLDASVKDVRQMATSSQEALKAVPDMAAASGFSDADVAALTARLEEMASQLDQVANAQTQQSQSYATLQSSLEEIPTGEGGGVSPAVVAGLKAQLADANSARDTLSQNVDAVTQKLGALSDSVGAASGNAASAQALSDVTTALRERLTRIEERLDLVAKAADDAAAPEALDSVNTAMEAAIGDFETRLGALENVRQQATAAMVAGLETARLAQAIGNGRAYAAELKALTQLKAQAGPALPDISDLLVDIQSFADTGIPSGATLAAQLEERSREILTAIDTPDGANWWERLLARLRNLVTVRTVGEGTQGTTAPDVLARAEVAARSGDWDAVVAEIGALPQSAQDSLGGWWDQAQARAAAQRALSDLNARLGVAASAADVPAQAGPAQ